MPRKKKSFDREVKFVCPECDGCFLVSKQINIEFYAVTEVDTYGNIIDESLLGSISDAEQRTYTCDSCGLEIAVGEKALVKWLEAHNMLKEKF